MRLCEEMTEAGGWLFRWRSYIPLSIVGLSIVSMYPFSLPGFESVVGESISVAGLFISFLGMGLRAFTVGHTPRRTSGRNSVKQIAESLNTTGIYSLVRHPLYLANFLIGLGLAVITMRGWFVLSYVLMFWIYYERIMLAEEAFLRSRFGYEFDCWAARTPAFIPRAGGYVAAPLPFSLRNVLGREYNTLLQIALVSCLIRLCGAWMETRTLRFEAPWVAFFGVSCLGWLLLRSLKRFTNVLNVEGR
jgi:protein-S-isoprenylcysteine O-methyltransferase Ste14